MPTKPPAAGGSTPGEHTGPVSDSSLAQTGVPDSLPWLSIAALGALTVGGLAVLVARRRRREH